MTGTGMRVAIGATATSAVLAGALLVARGASGGPTAAHDALQQDLDAAAATAAFAPAMRGTHAPLRFVSPLELGDTLAPARAASTAAATRAHPREAVSPVLTHVAHGRATLEAPRAAARGPVAVVAVRRTEHEATDEVAAVAPAPAAPAPIATAAESDAPGAGTFTPGIEVASAPTSGAGASGGPSPSTPGEPTRTRGGWGGMGGVIGVVIRGGGIGDDDHCEIVRPGRGGARMPTLPMPGRTGGGMGGGMGGRMGGGWPGRF